MSDQSLENVIRDTVAFKTEARGLKFVATYLTHPKSEALIEISRDGQMVKSLLWPAYKVWNIAAHADDIAADIEDGLTTAGVVGFGANAYQPVD
jgi:urease gamma subunit